MSTTNDAEGRKTPFDRYRYYCSARRAPDGRGPWLERLGMDVDRSPADVLGVLLAKRDDILEDYLRRMRAAANPIANRPESLAGAMAQAQNLLTELTELAGR